MKFSDYEASTEWNLALTITRPDSDVRNESKQDFKTGVLAFEKHIKEDPVTNPIINQYQFCQSFADC